MTVDSASSTTTADNKTIHLTQFEADLIRKEVVGIGGIQSIVRMLQSKLNHYNNTLSLIKEEIEKVKNCRIRYGLTGGYQTRLLAIERHFENQE